MPTGARVVVTGGAGFIGGHLVERLAATNDVVVLDRLPASKVQRVAASERVTYVEGDVRNPQDLERAFRGADRVFHLAALISPAESFAHPEAFNDVNTHGTLAVLRAAKATHVRRVVFASSCAVYGGGSPPLREDAPLDLLSPYAVTKAAGEMWCRLYHELGLETVALRLFNVYGPRQSAEGPYGAVIPKFLRAVAAKETPTVFGDGEQTRDFVYAADVAEAFERAATAEGVSGEIVNVGSGEPVSVNRLLAVVNDVLGAHAKPEYRQPRPGDIHASYADTAKAERLLGFRAKVSLAQGLLATSGSLA
jgi:nucleoside-diphosphate-sugar epimerase